MLPPLLHRSSFASQLNRQAQTKFNRELVPEIDKPLLQSSSYPYVFWTIKGHVGPNNFVPRSSDIVEQKLLQFAKGRAHGA